LAEDTKATKSALDALPREAQQLLIARCVAFSCAFLDRGESFFPGSNALAEFRRDFGADLQSFSEQLWETLPSDDIATGLLERFDALLDARDELPPGADKLDGHAEGTLFIVLTACGWLLHKERASAIARMAIDVLHQLANKEALAASGRMTMRGTDVDRSEWVNPEKTWQAHYVDRAQHGNVEELRKLAKASAQALIDLIPKINSVIVRSRS
jgi:hypothetical protein